MANVGAGAPLNAGVRVALAGAPLGQRAAGPCWVRGWVGGKVGYHATGCIGACTLNGACTTLRRDPAAPPAYAPQGAHGTAHCGGGALQLVIGQLDMHTSSPRSGGAASAALNEGNRQEGAEAGGHCCNAAVRRKGDGPALV